MDTAGLVVGTDSDVSVESWTSFGIINASEMLVEEVVETLMKLIGLAHDDSVTNGSRVTDGCYGIDLT